MSIDGSNGKSAANAATVSVHTVKVAIPAKDNNRVNLPLMVKQLLIHFKVASPDVQLLPKDGVVPKPLPLTKAADVPSNEAIENYAMDLSYNSSKDQHQFFLKIQSSKSFAKLKFENPRLINFLHEKRIWISFHKHSSHHAMAIGFISGVHPTYSSRDKLTSMMTPVLPNIEFNLTPGKQFYYDEDKRVQVEVVEVIVDPNDAETVHGNLIKPSQRRQVWRH